MRGESGRSSRFRQKLSAAEDRGFDRRDVMAHRVDVGRRWTIPLKSSPTWANRGAGFRSLAESIDTTTAGGRLVFHVMGALAEFERSLIQERTKAGLQAAKSRGVIGGRPRALSRAKTAHARKRIDAGESPASVAKSLGVGRSTLYRAF